MLRNGSAILNQLELHFYPTGGRGWCLTNKLPLFATNGEVVGLMGLSKDLGSNNKPCHDYAAVARAVQHIHNHFSEPLRVGELAAHVGLSGYQFEQRIRKIFQLTAGQLIQKIRMGAAVKRLRETKDSVATIAQDCGYSDQSAFTRQFRQIVGLPPSVYREQKVALRGDNDNCE